MSEREEPVSVSPEKPPAREDNSGGAIGRRMLLATARPVACCVALSGVMKSKGNTGSGAVLMKLEAYHRATH